MYKSAASAMKQNPRRGRILGLLLLVGAVALAYYQVRDDLTLDNLVRHEAALTAFTRQRFLASLAAAFLLYVAVTGSSLPVATLLSLACGRLFGFWPALLIVSFGSTSGATIAFLLSRYLLREAVQARCSGRLSAVNAALARDGAFYLFSLRLIPQIPFVVVNVLMGLSPLRLRTFWWVSQLGMLPATCIYVYTGSVLPSLAQLQQTGLTDIIRPQLLAGLTLLGVFPFLVKWIMTSLRKPGVGSS